MSITRTGLSVITAMLLSGVSLVAAAADYQGVLQWAHVTRLTTPVSGKVTSVPVQAGSRVKRGQVLLRLDAREFRARIAQARADVATAKVDAEEARRELKRSKELFDRTVISVHELQLVKIANTRAQSALQVARQRLRLARLSLEFSVLRAGYDARVIRRDVEPGQVVVTRLQATPLIVLASDRQMLATVDLDAEQASGLKPGMKASVSVGDKRFTGLVLRIDYRDSAGKPVYRVAVVFAHDPSLKLLAGQSARVSLR